MGRRNIRGFLVAAVTLAAVPRMLAGVRAKSFYQGHPNVTFALAQKLHGPSGFVYQRMGARDGKPHDVPIGSGTGLAA